MTITFKDIGRIQSRIEEVSLRVEAVKQSSHSGELPLSEKLQLQSWDAHLNDLKQQLRQAKESLAHEVFELRLFSGAMNGSLPLKAFSKLAHHLNGAIANAAYFLRYGSAPIRGVPEVIENELDLRFSGLSYGSTRLTLSGDVKPDITGESLLEISLEHIFSVLSAPSTEDLRTEVASIGIKAISELSSLMQALDSSGTGAELTWATRSKGVARWGGSLSEVQDTRRRLRPISSIKEETVSLSGTVSELKASGSIKVVPYGESNPITIRYNRQQQAFIEALHLNELIKLKVTKSGSRDELTGEDKYKYRLVTQSS
ncbi:hypothetical protein [Alcanivorax sp.]|uniref:hypothetical protein n=1 Tax=Alcanivorax sp. TaxID=1872427 RepID=UPI0025C66D8E|nr:hypothetical protein [Alcanivorax sp.]